MNVSKTPLNHGLNKFELMELEDQAIDLALTVFSEPTDEHIEAIQERLIWNAKHGLGTEGAVTLH